MTQTTTYNADGSYSVFTDDGMGDTSTANYNAAGVELSDSWISANGTSGSDIYNADGSSSGTTLNSDGSYSSYTNDGQGNVTTAYFNTSNVETNDTWTASNGSSGTDTFDAGGSSSGAATYANGTTSSYVNDGQGDIATKYFNASGVETNDTWSQSDGSSGTDTFNAAGSSGTTTYANGMTSSYVNDGRGDITTEYFNASGVETSDTWSKFDGSSGADTFNADGSSSGTAKYYDGTTSSYVNDGQGDITTTNYFVTGVESGDSWSKANGSSGTDVINGGAIASSTWNLGNASQSVTLGNQNYTITAGNGNDTINTGTGGGSIVVGNGNDSISGTGSLNVTLGSGNDIIIASGAESTLVGGTGNDTFVVNNPLDVIDAQAGGVNTMLTSYSPLSGNTYVAPANVQNVTGTGTVGLILFANNSATAVITGNSAADVLGAGTGSDTLVSGTGNDTLDGSTGNDTFVVNNVHDLVTAQAAGTNTIDSSVNFTASSNVPTLTGIGSAAITLTGNSLADVITANNGNDTLVAGSGPTTLVGGSGNDTFVLNNPGNVISETANTGNNTEQVSFSATLAANLQNLTGTGSAALTLTGNASRGTLTANYGNDTLISGSGVETLVGGSGSDTFIVNNAADVVNDTNLYSTNTELTSVSTTLTGNISSLTATGNASVSITGGTTMAPNGNLLTESLVANNGNDTLVGGTSPAMMIGGSGNDTFVVNSALDSVFQQFASGNNTVQSSINFVLPSNIQNLTGTGTGNISLTGNALNDVITGNAGYDNLIAGSGNDTLIAGQGPAFFTGGSGNDTFVVNNSNDQINDATIGTNNTVDTAVNFFLPSASTAQIQNLTATGSANVELGGNALNDVITSNSGIDTLLGGTGNDTFVVNNAADLIDLPAQDLANDTIDTSVSYAATANVQTLTGIGNANLALRGNSLNDVITANNGIDTLVGGTGNDTFVVNNAMDFISELANNGNNTVMTSVSYVLPANVQNIIGTGSANLNLSGNNLVNVLTSNSGIDMLSGSNVGDTYVVNNSADVINTSGPYVNTIESSVNFIAPVNTQNVTAIGSANVVVGVQSNTYNTVITSNSGVDTLVGGSGSGNETFVVNNAGDSVYAQSGPGVNTIDSSVSYTASANVQDLFMTGSAAVTATANSGNDLLVGNGGADTLLGGTGVDVLEAGSGTDTLVDTSGAAVLLAGAGADTLTSGAAAAFIAAGTGTNAINLGTGAAVVAYNAGDGPATITSNGAHGDVLSLGKGISYSNLTFSKSGNNLILNTGGGSSVTFANWYGGSANQDFVTLQVIEQSASTYNAASSNPLYSQEVEGFNFTQLVAAFNSALAANPNLTSWSLSNSLLTDHLSSSNTAAIGGDLAYYDGMNGNLTGMNLASAEGSLQNSNYGRSSQTIDAWSGISSGTNKLH